MSSHEISLSLPSLQVREKEFLHHPPSSLSLSPLFAVNDERQTERERETRRQGGRREKVVKEGETWKKQEKARDSFSSSFAFFLLAFLLPSSLLLPPSVAHIASLFLQLAQHNLLVGAPSFTVRALLSGSMSCRCRVNARERENITIESTSLSERQEALETRRSVDHRRYTTQMELQNQITRATNCSQRIPGHRLSCAETREMQLIDCRQETETKASFCKLCPPSVARLLGSR